MKEKALHPYRPLQLIALIFLASLGCGGGEERDRLEAVWGRKGLQPGDLIRPRAVAIDRRLGDLGDLGDEKLYVADFTGRIQAYTTQGRYLHGWSTPTIINGRPAGLGIGQDGNVLVADSHYNQVLVYSPEGELVRTITGRPGEGPGPFAYVSDVAQDADGNYYILEFGSSDRVQKFSAAGKYLMHWGNHGSAPGEFSRPRALTIGPDQCLYVADAANHRIQVFDLNGKLLRYWGKQGMAVGELSYPYDVALDDKGNVYVVEFGNHRVQRFSPQGEPGGCWGSAGREPGRLNSPWGLTVDRRGRVHIADTDNHRVQRVEF